MNKRNKNTSTEPLYVDVIEIANLFSVGKSTAYKIGQESNCSIKIGRRRLYNVEKLKKYMESLEND